LAVDKRKKGKFPDECFFAGRASRPELRNIGIDFNHRSVSNLTFAAEKLFNIPSMS